MTYRPALPNLPQHSNITSHYPTHNPSPKPSNSYTAKYTFFHITVPTQALDPSPNTDSIYLQSDFEMHERSNLGAAVRAVCRRLRVFSYLH
jgi:hypothetical protein